MNPRPPGPTSDPAAAPLTASGVGGDTNPHPSSAPGPHAFLSPPQSPDEIGRLGAYRVLAELGRGGMGVVFRAEDTTLRRQVALKVMLPDVAADARAVARFLREARAQAAVEHEHVAVIHYVGEANGVPFIAMPLLKGQTLAAALRQNPRPPLGELARIGREMAEGLAASHDKGLIHRDIKPANVWLDGPKRRVRILDFGLARTEATAPGDDEQLTGRGAILGTPAYMSPEQAKGEPVDHRSDLFSLGVVLYELATGKKPFAGANTLAVLFAVAEQHPPAAHQVAADVPLPLSELIWRLMAKAPPDRPASAAAVVAALEAFESGLSTSQALPLPVPTAVAVPVGPDPWAELTVAPDSQEEEEEEDETEYDEPPARSKSGGVPRWVWPAVGAAVLLAVAAGVWVAMPPRPKAVAELPSEGPKTVPGAPSPAPAPRTPPRDNPPAPNPPVPAPAPAPELTAENRAALEWVLANGGQLLLSVGGKDVPIPPGGKLPDGPFAVVGVSFIGAAVPDDAPARLAAAPRVQRGLGLNRATFADATVAGLLALPCFAGLTDLSLSESPATDAALVAVAKLPALVSLNLAQTKVTDAGLAHLRGLKLQNLSLHLCPVTDAGLDHLADMTSLTHLWLMHTRVTDTGLAKLTKLTNLTYLHPGPVTDAAVETLLTFRRLTDLHLQEAKLTAAGLKRLSALPALSELALGATPTADAGLAVLQDFPALRKVSLNSNGDRITDAGLRHLAECGGLRHLNLHDTRVTDAGVKALSAKLPLCEIVWGADQKIAPKPLDEVLRASVDALLKAGVGVSVPGAGMDRGRRLKTADELKDGERVQTIALLPPATFGDPAVRAAVRAFPVEGWDAVRAQLALGRPITAEQFRAVTRLPNMRPLVNLEFYNVDLPEAEFAHLKNLPRLDGVAIVQMPKLTAAGFGHLATTGARRLYLSNIEFDPRSLEPLRNSSVVGLHVSRLGMIDDAALEHLAPLTTLRTLDLKETKVTKAGVEKLAAALPRCRIFWDGGTIEPRSALGYGLEFDGKSSYVTFPTLRYDGSHPLTLEGWFAPTSPPNSKQSLLIDIQTAGFGLYLRPEPGVGWLYGGMAYTGGAYRHARSPGPPPGGRVLTHVAAVYDGKSQIRLFIDGKLTATTDAPGAFRPSPLAYMLGANPGVGNRADDEFFEGTVAGVRVSKVARYAADFAPRRYFDPDADTLALYRCDLDAGDVLTDSSGNNHHGKIVGAKWAVADEREVAANRRGAEKLNPHADLTVRPPGGKLVPVPKGGQLPDGPFTVVRIYLPPAKLPDRFADDVFLPAMADLRAAGDIGSLLWVLKLTDEQLARLAALPVAESMWYLSLGFELTGPAIDALKRFPHLGHLFCNATTADDALLERLSELPGLMGMSLEHLGKSGKVTARGAAALAKLPLRNVTLAGAPAAAEYAKRAAELRELVYLSVWGSPITDADVRHLSACERLATLHLDATRVTDAGLKHLEGAHALRYLGLTQTKVTEAGAKALAAKLPLCRIQWAGGTIEPAQK